MSQIYYTVNCKSKESREQLRLIAKQEAAKLDITKEEVLMVALQKLKDGGK